MRQEERPQYEEIVERMRGNLEDNEAFYYSALIKGGEYGKEGQRDGLYASLWGLREKVGLEGILSTLEAQGEASISGGSGLNAEYSLARVIENNAANFLESLNELKPRDIIQYIKNRINVEIEERYIDKQLKELTESNEEGEKTYGRYLIRQVANAVMAKVTPLAYEERARRENRAYNMYLERNTEKP